MLSSRDQKAEKSAKRRDQERLFKAEELDVQRPEGRESRHMRGAVAFWGSQCKWGVASRVRDQVRVWGMILAGQSSRES